MRLPAVPASHIATAPNTGAVTGTSKFTETAVRMVKNATGVMVGLSVLGSFKDVGDSLCVPLPTTCCGYPSGIQSISNLS
ncbi:hypothetical protein BDS110ZK4_40730 [Bradyrhizobium diazoefficiens]|uniref:Uncharacterized protein n=1 Tax=Bradyrhizobium diazoefficiens TaxID=1355477 RepID=A0A809ZJ84_9BRAD|nr:hypothetical protein XF1B_80090 [Bradyrhizobium diazoefficiens]BCE51587.1 hypothetical protein XF4B_79360 [Bradyrhizobium diazoefficiens]BCE95083.1 hypothetical protein XF10B_78810 [Bradyrhizobium diazoefficiens]BCF30029.1 hypothetical protein XF14B_79810 [Bradyrhizobium diazoefficiens]